MWGTLGIAFSVVAVATGCGRVGFDRRDRGAGDAGRLGRDDAGLEPPAFDAGATPGCTERGPIVAYDFGGLDGPTYPDVAPAAPDVPITVSGAVTFDATSAILNGGELVNAATAASELVARLRAAAGFAMLVWVSPATADQSAGLFAVDQVDRPLVTISHNSATANTYRFVDERGGMSYVSGLRPWTDGEITARTPRLLAITYEVATGRAQPFENGSPAGSGSDHEPGARFSLASEPVLRLGHTAFELEPGYWRGRIYRAEIHDRALTATEMRCVYETTPVP